MILYPLRVQSWLIMVLNGAFSLALRIPIKTEIMRLRRMMSRRVTSCRMASENGFIHL